MGRNIIKWLVLGVIFFIILFNTIVGMLEKYPGAKYTSDNPDWWDSLSNLDKIIYHLGNITFVFMVMAVFILIFIWWHR